MAPSYLVDEPVPLRKVCGKQAGRELRHVARGLLPPKASLRCLLSALLVVEAFFIPVVFGAKFEDEAGINDWLSEQVADVTHLIPSEDTGPSDNTFFVGTRHGVVAAFNELDGTLRWRRVHRESDRVERLERHASHLIALLHQSARESPKTPGLTVSPEPGRPGLYVQIDTTGSLVWSVEDGVSDFAVGRGQDGAPVVAILKHGGRGLEARNLADGHVLWTAGEGSELLEQLLVVPAALDGITSALAVAHVSLPQQDSALVVLYRKGPNQHELRMRVLAFKDGKQLGDVPFHAAAFETLSLVQGTPECAGFLTTAASVESPTTLIVASSNGEGFFVSKPLTLGAHGKLPKSASAPSVHVTALPVPGCFFAVTGEDSQTTIYRGEGAGEKFHLQQQYTLSAGPWAFGKLLVDGSRTASNIWTVLGGRDLASAPTDLVLATTVENDMLHAFVMDVRTGMQVRYLSLPFEQQKIDGQKLAMAVVQQRPLGAVTPSLITPELIFGRLLSGEALSARHAVLVTSDASLSLVTGEHWVWSREEGLADIRGTVMFAMPYTANHPAERRDWSSLPFVSTLLPSGLERLALEAALASPPDPSVQQTWADYLKLQATRLTTSAVLGALQMAEATVSFCREAVQGVRRAVQKGSGARAGAGEGPAGKRVKLAPFGFASLSAHTKLRLLGFVAFEGTSEETADLALNSAAAEEGRVPRGRKAPAVHVDPRLFGWTELILAATCSDQIYALHAATGLIVWQQSLSFWKTREAQRAAYRACRASSTLDASNFVGVSSTNGRKTSVGRVGPDGPSQGRPSPAGSALKSLEMTGIVGMHLVGEHKKELLAVVVDSRAKITRLVWLDATVGTVLHVAVVPFVPAHIVPLQAVSPYHHQVASSTTEQNTQTFFERTNGALVVDASGKASVLIPRKAETETELATLIDCEVAGHLSQHLSLYELDVARQQLFGFLVRSEELRTGGQPGVAQCGLRIQKTWNIPFSGSGQDLIASARPLHSDYPHVPVSVTGNISIVYKYINPNLMAVVTKTERGDTELDGAGALLMLHVVNLTDGSVIYSEYLPSGASLPLHLMMYDNVVMAHYWNLQQARYELHFVELQDAQKDEGPLSIIFSAARHIVPRLTGFELPPPTGISQTYILPTGVRAFGVTATLQGITTRAILLATSSSHQIYTMSTRLANARRPRLVDERGLPLKEAGPAQQQQEEGVLPYHPLLPLLPHDCISYYNQVFHVRGIAAHHTLRESTSSTFAFGLDLFFSPVQPAKGYDVLSSQFNYGLLAAAMVTLLVLVVLTRWRAKEADLAAKWK
ncbi:putative transmembrane protein [Toxoplasma gondii CAST]|uniref:ER membrane protein complex subunit 1 n=1 Tax=Toxoplasma gondii CAST TaxID=943122 RepID=A0A3R7YTX5_TOXGO|nr:putative transmembrane protein [Toxoplasma gondii CAST]